MEERQEHKASRAYVLYAPRTLQLIFFLPSRFIHLALLYSFGLEI
jgi:hypothetical protein